MTGLYLRIAPFFICMTMPAIVSEDFIHSVINECPHSCTLLFWGMYVKIHADKPEIIQTVSFVYSRFVTFARTRIDVVCCIQRSPGTGRRPVMLLDGVLYELPDSERFIGHADLILFRHLLEQLTEFAVLHAAVVTRNNRALVIYGQSGFGKTTLALELVRRGYGFMSDEFCSIRLSDFMIEPFERRVGLKPSSPFFGRIDNAHLRYLASEDKYFFDCSDIFACGVARPCKPAAFIEITAAIDADVCPPGGVVIDICMCVGSSDTVLSALESLPGVTLSQPLYKGSFTTYRVTAQDRQFFLNRFNRIWIDNSREIFSIYPYRGEIETYDRTPVLRTVPPFNALTSIFANIVNRAPTGRLLAAHGGKTAPLIMRLGDALKESVCYSLQPGQLAKTADLIDNLAKTDDKPVV